ncbi:uncharacterized protein LOC143195235 [Rhynchophorus ferrugineus]|uniref:Uncharacterized protein n=1 Tax=Rhynchophorus ferrugineus TaxID=354439 RepID=A0A834IJQ8_RHYFE|nr:hypothetical protein GWI33_005637 [Rhynchophorus ferrugineus]
MRVIRNIPNVAAIVLLVFYMLCSTQGYDFSVKKRVKRKVLFTKSSKFFFRLNGKDNILTYTSLLAHGWGFRINFDLPHTLNQRRLFFKRDVHEDIENIKNPVASTIANCVLAKVCSVFLQIFPSNKCGVFCGIAKIVASSQGLEADFFKSFGDKCQLYRERCPADSDASSSIFGIG